MILSLLTSTNTSFGTVGKYDAFYRYSGVRCNIYPRLTLFGGEVAAVNDWGFILSEDFSGEVLAFAAIA